MIIATIHFFRKLSLNKHMVQQQDTKHDQLNMEYDALWSNTEIILEQLEHNFDTTFDAKCFLTDIFMVQWKRAINTIIIVMHFLTKGCLQEKQAILAPFTTSQHG